MAFRSPGTRSACRSAPASLPTALDNSGALYSDRAGRPTPVGTIGGHTLTAHAEEGGRPDHGREITSGFSLLACRASSLTPEGLTSAGVGSIRAIENKVFAKADELARAAAEVKAIDAQLAALARGEESSTLTDPAGRPEAPPHTMVEQIASPRDHSLRNSAHGERTRPSLHGKDATKRGSLAEQINARVEQAKAQRIKEAIGLDRLGPERGRSR